MTLVRISAPHFVAGLWLDKGRVQQTAPILRYMQGWTAAKMDRYCQRKGWRAENVGTASESVLESLD